MTRKRTIIFVVLFLLITNVITFGMTNLVTLQFKERVIISKDEYQSLTQNYNEFGKLSSIKKYIDNNYLREVNNDDLVDGQIKGMVASLNDPYSAYMNDEEFKSFTEDTSGLYGGIGVIVTPGEDNLITIVSPLEDTPGERAGLKTGDKIVKVNGVEYYGENMDEAVKIMRGDPNTKVNLSILRTDKNNDKETLDIEITREIIRLVTVKSSVIDNNIGYLRITSFDEITYDDFKDNLKGLENNGVEGLIIDLRSNPGGLLNICADIADELLGEGDIVFTQTKDGQKEYLKSDRKQTELPLVVLVNEGSASASEILAGAIKDHNRGQLIGTTTFGKGVVQRIRDLGDGTGIKLTVSEYFTPNGTNIHGIGITPDIVVELPEEAEGIGLDYLDQDLQLQKALEVIKGKI